MVKYYTPEIEEFYHGFEYEVWYSSAYTKENWIKETFEFYDKDEIYHYDSVDLIPSFKSNGDSIRVKYLDKEDIESLGFSQITDDCFNISNINYRGLVDCDLRILIRKTILIYIIEPNDTSHTLFTGNIKNKSELVKLLKQLQIE